MNGHHAKLIERQASLIDRITEDITELKVETAKQAVQIQSIDSKVGYVQAGVDEIKDTLVKDAKESSKFWRGWGFKLLMLLLGSGIGGGGAAAAINAMKEDPKPPPAIEQVQELPPK